MELKLLVNKIKNFFCKNYAYIIPLTILFLIFLILNLCSQLKIDDIAEKAALDKLGGLTFNNLIQYLNNAYNKWSSRVGIGVFTAVFVYVPLLFKFLNPVVLCFCCFMFYKILSTKRLVPNLIIVLLILALDYGCYYDAGIIPTNTNYLWPITFMLPSLYLVIKEFKNEKLKICFCTISLILFLLLSFWSEQVVFCSTLVLLFLIIYRYINSKKLSMFSIILLIICILAIINIFVCPGNRIRAKTENPELYNLPFFQKVARCILFPCKAYCNKYCLVCYVFFLLIPILVFSKQNKLFFINSLISLVFFLIYMILLELPNSTFKYKYVWNIYNINGISIVIMAIFLLSILISLIKIFWNNKKIIFIIVCFCISNFSIAFTGFSDGDAPARICLFSYLGSILIVYYLLYEIDAKYFKNSYFKCKTD